MCEKLSKIAEKYNLKLKIVKLPSKVRAFIVEIDNNTYIVVNDSLSDEEKEKAFLTRTFAL